MYDLVLDVVFSFIVTNGNIEDNAVLMDEPFCSLGSITVLFKDDLGKAKEHGCCSGY